MFTLGRPRIQPLIRRCRSIATVSQVLPRRPPLDIHPEIQDALASNKPVVTLETTLVTHGFPYPTNLELGIALENIVREAGAIPATIGIIGGRVKIGLEHKDLERLADRQHNPSVVKVSRRDIGPAIATGADGGTTCSATLIFTAMAGIKVFATGGLGGVHRGGESSMDISADLNELARCPVGLVSSGVKSILDIGRTLQYLETLGVPVVPYGPSKEFPAFFSRHSGHKSPWNVEDPLTAARILHTQWQFGMENGALIAVPIPEEYEAAGARLQEYVDQAVAESEANGINKKGGDATPWLLTRIGELSKGESLKSNSALLKNTALVGSQIALQYHKLVEGKELSSTKCTVAVQRKLIPREHIEIQESRPGGVMAVGCAAIDLSARADTSFALTKHSTTPGEVSISLGGVARNIAEASHRISASRGWNFSTVLVSPIGRDPFGEMLVKEIAQLGMDTNGLIRTGRTAVCNMFLNSRGDLVGGVADMAATEALDPKEIISKIRQHRPRIIALDGNLSPAAIQSIVEHSIQQNIQVFFEPTSVHKSTTIFPAVSATLRGDGTAPIGFVTPNRLELAHMHQVAQAESTGNLTSHPAWWAAIDSFGLDSTFRVELEQLARQKSSDRDASKGNLSFLVEQGTVQMAIQLLPFFQHLVIKCGGHGILVVMRSKGSMWAHENSNPHCRCVVAHGPKEQVVVHHFPALSLEQVVNVTGAGDTLVGVLLAQLTRNPHIFDDRNTLTEAIHLAQKAAILTLQSNRAVSSAVSQL